MGILFLKLERNKFFFWSFVDDLEFGLWRLGIYYCRFYFLEFFNWSLVFFFLEI